MATAKGGGISGRHPDLEAAEIFDRLAATVKDVDPKALLACEELFEDGGAGLFSEMMGHVGFHWWPETAPDFVKLFISKQTGGTVNPLLPF
jgi:hypothetical protein